MAYHIIQVDGSMKGLGTTVLQKGRLSLHVSRTLMPAETGFSDIERELLSVVIYFERLHNYVFDSTIKVQTDHKPWIATWKMSTVAVSPQVKHFILRLSKYDLELPYLKGKDNVIAEPYTELVHWNQDLKKRTVFISFQPTTSLQTYLLQDLHSKL